MPSLINWPVFGLKVGLAVALAVWIDKILNFHDPISAGFVALVCVSPTVFTGMRRAFDQFAGSILGGLIGLAVLLLGGNWPMPAAVAVAVGLSAGLAGVFKTDMAHIVAAFAALWMIILGSLTPVTSFWLHLGAVTAGAGASSLLNILVSGLLYRMVFTRRMRILRGLLADCFDAAVRGEDRFGEAFGMISGIASELNDASQELLAKWLGVQPLLKGFIQEIGILEEVAHYGRDALLRDEGSANLFRETRDALHGGKPALVEEHPLAEASQRWSHSAKAL